MRYWHTFLLVGFPAGRDLDTVGVRQWRCGTRTTGNSLMDHVRLLWSEHKLIYTRQVEGRRAFPEQWHYNWLEGMCIHLDPPVMSQSHSACRTENCASCNGQVSCELCPPVSRQRFRDNLSHSPSASVQRKRSCDVRVAGPPVKKRDFTRNNPAACWRWASSLCDCEEGNVCCLSHLGEWTFLSGQLKLTRYCLTKIPIQGAGPVNVLTLRSLGLGWF